MIRLALLLVTLVLPVAAQAQAHREIPRYDCRSDIGWQTFSAALNLAIARHDVAAIMRVVADDVSNGFEPSGRRAFSRIWGLDRPATSRLWRELSEIMRLGCARDREGRLWIPSMMLDEEAPDDATHGSQAVAVRAGMALRAAPSDRSRIVARLNWHVLWLPENDDGRGAWVRATLDNDRQGYVRRSQIRAFTDHYALFEKQNGRWRLISLVRGE